MKQYINHHSFNKSRLPGNHRNSIFFDFTVVIEYPVPEAIMALAREAVVGNYGSSVKINTGVALCHADDEYNKRVGVETAKQKIKPVSFKLKGFRFDNERKNNLTIGEILFYLLPENPPVKRGEIDMLVIKIVDGKYVRLKHVSLKGHLSL